MSLSSARCAPRATWQAFLGGKTFLGGDVPNINDYHIVPVLNMVLNGGSEYYSVASSTILE